MLRLFPCRILAIIDRSKIMEIYTSTKEHIRFSGDEPELEIGFGSEGGKQILCLKDGHKGFSTFGDQLRERSRASYL